MNDDDDDTAMSGASTAGADLDRGGDVPLPQRIADRIRDDIMSGRLAPGARLREDVVAAESGASRLPTREAFAQLAAEGFIELIRYKGAVVATPSPSAGHELVQVRGALEALAASLAAERRGGDQLADMQETIELGRRAMKDGDWDRLPGLIERFHVLVAEASGNAELVSLLDQVRNRCRWIFRIGLPERSDASWHEHEQIYEAIRAGFPGLAAELMARHVDSDDHVIESVVEDPR